MMIQSFNSALKYATSTYGLYLAVAIALTKSLLFNISPAVPLLYKESVF